MRLKRQRLERLQREQIRLPVAPAANITAPVACLPWQVVLISPRSHLVADHPTYDVEHGDVPASGQFDADREGKGSCQPSGCSSRRAGTPGPTRTWGWTDDEWEGHRRGNRIALTPSRAS